MTVAMSPVVSSLSLFPFSFLGAAAATADGVNRPTQPPSKMSNSGTVGSKPSPAPSSTVSRFKWMSMQYRTSVAPWRMRHIDPPIVRPEGYAHRVTCRRMPAWLSVKPGRGTV